jgi:hypothetical protein
MVFVWTLDSVLFVVVMGLVGLLYLWVMVPLWWEQVRCKHDEGVTENQACDAFCRKCGKNLGFIGSLENRGQPHPK